jgi:hypothetical protein
LSFCYGADKAKEGKFSIPEEKAEKLLLFSLFPPTTILSKLLVELIEGKLKFKDNCEKHENFNIFTRSYLPKLEEKSLFSKAEARNA